MDEICLGSCKANLEGRLNHTTVAMAVIVSTITMASAARRTPREGVEWDFDPAGSEENSGATESAGARLCVAGISAMIGAINRYPRRGTVSTYWGLFASSPNASRMRFTALFRD